MNFRQALNILAAQLTPRPWEHTDPSTGTTLTVIPAGHRAHPGEAEVYIRITASKTLAAQAAITTTHLPALITAIEENADFVHEPQWGTDSFRFITSPSGPVLLVREDDHRDGAWHAEVVAIHIPEEQRLPLVSALRRAADVAAGWEQ